MKEVLWAVTQVLIIYFAVACVVFALKKLFGGDMSKRLTTDDSQIFENARVYDDAKVSKKERAHLNARVYDDAKVSKKERAHLNARVYGDV